MFFINTREKLTSSSFIMHMLPAGAVLVTMLGLSFLSWRNSMEALRNERDALTTSFSQDVKTEITEKLNAHNLILTGSAGLFSASTQVTKDEWGSYIKNYDLTKNYPGIQGIGYAVYTQKYSDLATIAESAKRDGITDFQISTADNKQEYVINYFFEPKKIYPQGYDLANNKQRIDVIRRAISSGTTNISGRRNFSDEGQPERIGFCMFIPVYTDFAVRSKPIDQKTVEGFAYMPVLSQDFFDQIVILANNKKFGLRIYDEFESSDNLLYESSNYTQISADDHYARKTTINMYGRTWTLDFMFDPAIISDTTRNRPLNSIIAGVLLSFLLSGFVLTLLAARTRALSHSQELEVQNVKDELLSLASHQLRTPATSVKQYVGMVLEGFAGKVPNRQRVLLDKAYESNERQLHIINELLYVAKIDAKGIVLSPRKLNINRLIKEVVQDFISVAKANKQKIVLEVPKRIVFAEADEHCLRMSLENLVNNALKYSHTGRQISIKLSNRNEKIIIAVKDRGIGIAEEDIPLLFKQFSRIPNEFSIKSSGSGIGLYLSQQLINLHGGEITVASEPGSGTTFTIHLPKTQSFESIDK